MQKISVNAYTYDELSEVCKKRVLYNEIEFIALTKAFKNQYNDDPILYAEMKSKEFRTPWFFYQYIFNYCKDEIMENVRNYLYDLSGNILECMWMVRARWL